MFLDLEQRFEIASDITEDEARAWSRQLVTAKRKARTVNDVWLTAARTVFAWAQEERLITSNPFKDVRVTEPRRVKHRETDAFMPDEWTTILRAASAIGEPKTTFQGAQRWVPWHAPTRHAVAWRGRSEARARHSDAADTGRGHDQDR